MTVAGYPDVGNQDIVVVSEALHLLLANLWFVRWAELLGTMGRM